jgi:asparagine synthase (glutamine-hydrolysing)
VNRLAVRFGRTGTSPQVTLDGPARAAAGDLELAWDGRIDNREEIGASLGLPAGALGSLGDEALLLSIYARLGIDALSRVVGEYAFALWDRREGALLCARDPLGQRPFFYYGSPSTFVAGSTLAAVLAHPDVPRHPNEGVVAEYLAGAITNRDQTLYDGVRRLPPGTWMRIDRTGERRGTIAWVDPAAEIRYVREDEYAEHLRELLRVAVRARLRGVSRVGVELSGGLDSSTVAAIARAELGDDAPHRLSLWSLVFPGLSCDEQPLIEACQRAWGLPAHSVAARGDAAADATADHGHRDFPYYPNGTMSVEMRRRARGAGIRVLLTGIGGDEWFSGSRFHVADDLRRGRVRRAIRQARSDVDLEGGMGTTSALFAYGAWPAAPQPLKRIGRWARGTPAAHVPWIPARFALRTDLAMRMRVRPEAPHFPTHAQADMYRNAVSGWSIHGSEMEARLAADLDIELRHPFADLRIARFGLAIPESLRWAGRERKRVLRAAAAGLVPEVVRVRRSKVDFSPVLVQALEAQGGAKFFRHLGTAALGWVDAGPLDRMYAHMLSRYAAGDPAYMAQAWGLWMVAGIERWARAAGFVTAFRDSVARAGTRLRVAGAEGHMNQEQASTESNRRADADRKRRPYSAPKLVEYGSVAKLTQGGGMSTNGDGGQMMRV